MSVHPFPIRPGAIIASRLAIESSATIDVLADRLTLIEGRAQEPADERAGLVRSAALILLRIEALDRADARVEVWEQTR